MKMWYSLPISIFFLVHLGTCQSSQTIVPKNDQVTDFETRFALARVLSHHTETQEAALRLYRELLHEEQLPFSLALPEMKRNSENSGTIVPQTAWITRFNAAWTLAKIYSHQERTRDSALILYSWLLQEEPDNIDVTIEMGRLYIALKRYQDSLSLFHGALEKYKNNLKLLTAAAQAEVSYGHAKEAKTLFKAALRLSEGSDTFLIDYADGMMMWGDYYKAEEIYRNALCKNPCSTELLLRLAGSFEAQQRYEEAEGIYSQLLAKRPKDLKIMESLARLKILEKEFDQAQDLVETILQIQPEAPKYLQIKAEILFQKLLYCDAIAMYSQFKNDPKQGVRAYVGIGRAYLKMGLDSNAYAAFKAAYNLDPTDIEARYYLEENVCEKACDGLMSPQDLYEWANISMQNGKPEIALSLYSTALEIDPKYFPAEIGKAETLSNLFFYSSALEIYEDLLQFFPGNAKLMLAIARVLAWSKNYQCAFKYYDKIIESNPSDPVPHREKARTALWGKDVDAAMTAYNQVLCQPVDDFGRYLIWQSVSLEKRAKKLNWNRRSICSLGAYENLVTFNPGNEEALFDYAQVYCGLGLCEQSRCLYEHILDLDPNHKIVQMALERNEARNNPGLQGNFTYWREIGSGSFSASQIARYRLDEVFEMPLSCRAHFRFIQQEYVENPFYNFKFYPAEGQAIEADYLFNEHLTVFVSAAYKNYFGTFDSTITSRNRLLYTVNDYLQVLLSYSKEDEIYNYFSLKQAIQSNISLITLSSKLTRYWNVSGTYQYYRYNDDNSQFHFNFLTEYQFTEEPNVFRAILQGDYRNAAEQTVLIIDGTQLVNMIHPYWTPNKYLAGSLTMQWKHDYREFEFCEAPQRYFDIKITGLVDNADNPSISGIVEWKHEFNCHWGFEIKGFIQRGPLWNAEGGWGTLEYRF